MEKLFMGGAIAAFLSAAAVWAAVIAALVTHVVVCIKAGAWILLAFGCVIVPVGVIHGVGAWFGVWS